MSAEHKEASTGGRALLGGLAFYLIALALMHLSIPPGVKREAVQIAGPAGKPCLGTIWTPATPPKAVMLIGHGVSSNQGMMAGVAKAFAGQGYVAVTLDFWGHGRSHERFDWRSNPGQILAWCAWASEKYPKLPLGYLGHSMGGFGGAEAFSEKPAVKTFVAMGALPPHFPKVKTAVAVGRFEELFPVGTLADRISGKADVVFSPFSDHVSEATDPVLIKRIIIWVDDALGVAHTVGFSWLRWVLFMPATLIGGFGAFLIARHLTSMLRGPSHSLARTPSTRSWSVNPYRVTGRLFGCAGYGNPPRTDSIFRATLLGCVFAVVVIVLLSILLNTQVFTSRLDNPARLIAWPVAALVLLAPALLHAAALERVALASSFQRFAITALTHSLPLFVLGFVLRFFGPGLAFSGMMLCIFGLLMILIADVYASATRSAGDYRSGAVASSVVLGWMLAFWFPLVW